MGNAHHHSCLNSKTSDQIDLTMKKKVATNFLSEKDTRLIRTSWNQLKVSHDLKQLGIEMMVIIFTKHPEIKFIWKFASSLQTDEEYRTSSQLKSHGYKVMEAVNAYVNALGNIESSDKLLQDLGNRHSSYGDGNIKKDYFSIVTSAILETIKKGLLSDYTPEVAQAWNNAISHLKVHIQSGLIEH